MNEPEYTYVRGQGWIIRRGLTMDFLDGNNELCRLVCEERAPGPGEKGWNWYQDLWAFGDEWFMKDVLGLREGNVTTRWELGWWDAPRQTTPHRTFTVRAFRIRDGVQVLK